MYIFKDNQIIYMFILSRKGLRRWMPALAAGLSVFFAACAGIIGSMFTTEAIPTWYATLNKPWFNPPNWLFGPAWTTLYILMGLAAFLILKNYRQTKKGKQALVVYLIQLVLNAAWSIIFFGFYSPGAALIEIILLWVFILWTIIIFWRLRRTAGILLLPYIMWVSFAAILNFFI